LLLTMATIFYIILVFFSGDVHWNWWWFIISLFFDGGEKIITKYKYTNNPYLEGTEA